MNNEPKAALVPELSCSDFHSSVDFYTKVLGFELVFERPERMFAYLALGEAQIMIKQANEYWNTAKLLKPYGRGINFQISVEDALGLSGKIEAHGFQLFEALGTSWYRIDQIERGVIEFLVQDPDGYLLRFSQLLGDRPVT
ncbi:MAG: VOC family protein [Rhodobacteraceae bacterium]|nr:VOC family protein [Paracoccaceae bacterium]